MPNASRAFVDQACYHITTRGNQKQNVFKEEEDYKRYLGQLKKALRKYSINLYAYCLMRNHVHLLIEPEHGRDISRFMHWINRAYTAYFNEKYSTVGHLWQGRFRSKPILKDRYLINCAGYIEENPIRAGLANNITDYRWSSYTARCLSSVNNLIDDIIVEDTKAGATAALA
jgi:putative transposase